ncbi:hypothetical protein TL16_g00908 [Triparma laevis f. inornata]|uniref:Uncharacterized protein n=1 Tax=Triparma laevis f. inornata TaxID=1714386 RepID=A0A9W6ZEH8_9STRA|nr:hypothetical protein TL16_g00908 [Triparma laevis f. inornata]
MSTSKSDGSANSSDLRRIDLLDLIISHEKKTPALIALRSKIITSLETHGYILLTYPKSLSSSSSSSSTLSSIHSIILKSLLRTITSINDLIMSSSTISSKTSPWPPSLCPLTAGSVYFNENNTPMYKLGYDDGTGGTNDASNDRDPIREYYRVCSGDVEGCGGFINGDEEGTVRILNMCRYICDVLLKTTFHPTAVPLRHANSSIKSWVDPSKILKKIGENGRDDYSILYGMNYFNTNEAVGYAKEQGNVGGDGRLLNLKEHVDPSLWVLEPVLGEGVGGLEVFDELRKEWILCDGVKSKLNGVLGEGEAGMVAFVGKGFVKSYEKGVGKGEKEIKPTLHRVVAPAEDEIGRERRSVIFEQKYGEYM